MVRDDVAMFMTGCLCIVACLEPVLQSRITQEVMCHVSSGVACPGLLPLTRLWWRGTGGDVILCFSPSWLFVLV